MKKYRMALYREVSGRKYISLEQIKKEFLQLKVGDDIAERQLEKEVAGTIGLMEKKK